MSKTKDFIKEDKALMDLRDVDLDISTGVDDTTKNTFAHQVKKKYEKKQISIRIVNHALEKIRRDARKDGIPYQSLINLILVRYSEGQYDI